MQQSTYFIISNSKHITGQLKEDFNCNAKLCCDSTNKCYNCPIGYYFTNLDEIQDRYMHGSTLYEVEVPKDALIIKHNKYKSRANKLNIINKCELFSKKTVDKYKLIVNRTFLTEYLITTRDLNKDKYSVAKEYKDKLDYIAIANIYCRSKSLLRQLYNLHLIDKRETEECLTIFSCYEGPYKGLDDFLKFFLNN